MFNDSSYSLADIAAATNSSNDVFGSNNGLWIFIILLVLFGGWGNNGYGFNSSKNGVLDNYVLGSDFSNLSRQIDTSTDRLAQQSNGIANGICDGFYTQAQLVNGIDKSIANTGSAILTQMNNNAINSMQDTFGLQSAINGVNVNNNTNTQAIISQMTANEANRQACCCQTNNLLTSEFGNLKYNMAAQDCQIRQTVNDVGRNLADVGNENTRSILAAIQSIKDDAKDQKIADQASQINALQLAASQQAQNNYIISQLKASPVPAYQVPNPYTGTYGYACGCGCSQA